MGDIPLSVSANIVQRNPFEITVILPTYKEVCGDALLGASLDGKNVTDRCETGALPLYIEGSAASPTGGSSNPVNRSKPTDGDDSKCTSTNGSGGKDCCAPGEEGAREEATCAEGYSPVRYTTTVEEGCTGFTDPPSPPGWYTCVPDRRVPTCGAGTFKKPLDGSFASTDPENEYPGADKSFYCKPWSTICCPAGRGYVLQGGDREKRQRREENLRCIVCCVMYCVPCLL